MLGPTILATFIELRLVLAAPAILLVLVAVLSLLPTSVAIRAGIGVPWVVFLFILEAFADYL